METFEMLFSPITINQLKIRNRLFMPPMGTQYATIRGEVTDRMIRYYEERGKGGVGLITFEFTYASQGGNVHQNNAGLYGDGMIPGYKRLVDAVHVTGAKICIQLAHAGRRTHSRSIGEIPVAPSPIPRLNGEVPRELTAEEIQDLVEDFSKAAARAKMAGFDAVMIHMAHGYLINQFLSPRTNKRQDRYGGDPENRARFAIEILRKIREKVGRDFPIISRLCGDDQVKGGFDRDQSKYVARKLEENGIDAIDISTGANEGLYGGAAPSYRPPGFLTHLSKEIKEAVRVPVGIVGRINDPYVAENILKEGKADFVSIGRPLIADPEFPQKIFEGRLEEVRPCTACNLGCIDRMTLNLEISCQVNPMVGRELDFGIEKASKRRKIFIVGGGPAGLEAARVAAVRGHEVSLYEKEKRLGGQLHLAARPPGKVEYGNLVRYYEHQMKKLGVTIIHKEVNQEEIEKLKPEIIVCATGGKPNMGSGVQIESNLVFSSWEILKGEKEVGEKVVVIGGGQVGCEVADFLLEQGKRITILEMADNVAADMSERARAILLDKLIKGGVEIIRKARVTKISNTEVRYERAGLMQKIKNFGHAVLALGTVSEQTLFKDLERAGVRVFPIGDCISPRKAIEAIREGFDLALEI